MSASLRELKVWATARQRPVTRVVDAALFALVALACFVVAYLSWQGAIQSPRLAACEGAQALPVLGFLAKFWWLHVVAGVGWLTVAAHAARSPAFSRLLSLALMSLALTMVLSALPLLSAAGLELERCAAG